MKKMPGLLAFTFIVSFLTNCSVQRQVEKQHDKELKFHTMFISKADLDAVLSEGDLKTLFFRANTNYRLGKDKVDLSAYGLSSGVKKIPLLFDSKKEFPANYIYTTYSINKDYLKSLLSRTDQYYLIRPKASTKFPDFISYEIVTNDVLEKPYNRGKFKNYSAGESAPLPEKVLAELDPSPPAPAQ